MVRTATIRKIVVTTFHVIASSIINYVCLKGLQLLSRKPQLDNPAVWVMTFYVLIWALRLLRKYWLYMHVVLFASMAVISLYYAYSPTVYTEEYVIAYAVVKGFTTALGANLGLEIIDIGV